MRFGGSGVVQNRTGVAAIPGGLPSEGVVAFRNGSMQSHADDDPGGSRQDSFRCSCSITCSCRLLLRTTVERDAYTLVIPQVFLRWHALACSIKGVTVEEGLRRNE